MKYLETLSPDQPTPNTPYTTPYTLFLPRSRINNNNPGCRAANIKTEKDISIDCSFSVLISSIKPRNP